MPILWRYLFKEYLKVFFLSILAFICILLITRLKQIAGFATLASGFISLILFVFYQIPYILPIAISISCLISSVILFQKMSNIKDSYVEISAENKDLAAKDLLIITPNKSNQRLCMFIAKNLKIENENLIG